MITSIANMSPNNVGHLACDDTSDIANLSDYARSNRLGLGSDCIVVETGTVLMMKSDYTWKEL